MGTVSPRRFVRCLRAGHQGAQIQWFEDRDSLIAFLLEDFVDLLADVGELDEDQTERARERFTLLVEQSFDDRGLMDAINDLASGLRRIAWLGPLRAGRAER